MAVIRAMRSGGVELCSSAVFEVGQVAAAFLDLAVGVVVGGQSGRPTTRSSTGGEPPSQRGPAFSAGICLSPESPVPLAARNQRAISS